MPKDKKYFSSEDRRQIEILGMCLPDLKNRDAVSIYELCELFMVSRPTIERDLNKLRERGIPIHSRANEGVVIEGNVSEELLRKEFIRYIAVYYDDYFGEFIKLNGRDKEIAQSIRNLVIIQNNIDRKTQVHLNGSKMGAFYCFPQKILRKDGEWFLIYEDYKKTLFTKSLNDIYDADSTLNKDEHPRNPDLDAYIDRNFGLSSKTKYEVTLLFSTKMNGAFPNQISKAKVVQTDERGYRTVVAECADLDDLLYWVIANHEKVMLLDPPELKERLMSKAKRMIKYYEAGSELFSCETIEPPPYIRSTENPIKFYEPEEANSKKYLIDNLIQSNIKMKRIKYNREKINTYTLTNYVNKNDIINSLRNQDDAIKKQNGYEDKVSEIEELYSNGKGLYAWDDWEKTYNAVAAGDYLVILFSKLNEIFLGRVYMKFEDPESYFQKQVNWDSGSFSPFCNIILFDEGKYFTEIPADILKTIDKDEKKNYLSLSNILNDEFVEVSNCSEIPSIPDNVKEDNLHKSIIQYIYQEKEAIYRPGLLFKDSRKDVKYLNEELKIYLGTYFPRSMTQCLSIFSDINSSNTFQSILKKKNEINILDIGSGTGGNLFGLLSFLMDKYSDKIINILSIDKCKDALNMQMDIFNKFFLNNKVHLKTKHWYNTNSKESIIERLSNDLNIDARKYDIILTFKFVNEIYKQDNKNTPLYRLIIETVQYYLNDEGIILLADITDRFDNNNYLPIQMSKEIQKYVHDNANKLQILLPLSCAFYEGQEPCQKCYKNKIFRNTNRFYAADKEKLCYFVLTRPTLKENILKEINQSDEFCVAETYSFYNICSQGVCKRVENVFNSKNAFSIKENIIK